MPNISLTNTTSQLAELQRRQKLADMLTAQSNEPFEIQSYKGIQAPISPYAGLAKVLQAYVGAKQASDIEKKRGEIGKISSEEFTNFMKNYEGTPEVRSDVKTVAASQPAPLAAPTAPPEMINTAKPFIAAGTPPKKMAQALQSSMGKGDIIASPQRIYGNAAPEAAPEAAVLAQARTNTPQEKMAMLMQGMTSGNPYMEKFAPAMYDEARQEEKANKVFNAIGEVSKEYGADPKIMAGLVAAGDSEKGLSYLVSLGASKADAKEKMDRLVYETTQRSEDKAEDRLSRESIAAQSLADRQEGRAQTSADRRFLAGLVSGRGAATESVKLRKEFNALPEVKEFKDVSTAYNNLKSAAKDPSAAGDLSIIFGYMKMLDPTSVVREGEQASAANATGVPDQIKNIYNRVATGKRLNPAQRQDFLNQAEGRFQNHAGRYKSIANTYRGYASESGYDPDRVVSPADLNLVSPPKNSRQVTTSNF